MKLRSHPGMIPDVLQVGRAFRLIVLVAADNRCEGGAKSMLHDQVNSTGCYASPVCTASTSMALCSKMFKSGYPTDITCISANINLGLIDSHPFIGSFPRGVGCTAMPRSGLLITTRDLPCISNLIFFEPCL